MSDPIHELHQLVLTKIDQLGEVAAKEYFDVSAGTISSWRNRKTNPSLAAAAKVYDETLKYNAPEATTGEKTKACLLMPMYDSVTPLTFFTLWRCMKLYGPDNITLIPKWRSLIDEARCDLAERFLLTGSEWAIYCDDDMVLPCGSGGMLRKHGLAIPEPKISRNAIERLLSHPPQYRIVGALYKDRRGGTKAQCASAFGSEARNNHLLSLFTSKPEVDGLEEEGWIGGGLFRVHRSVFLEMKESAKPGGPLADIAPPKGRENDPFGFFGRSAQFRGEDVFFARRAGQIGIKSYLDCGLICGHEGSKIY